MSKFNPFLCLLALACILSPPAPAADCPQADQASVVQTLNRLYAAADAHDADRLRDAIATDFVAQEDGERVSGQALLERVAAGAPAASAPARVVDASAVEASDGMDEHAVIRQPEVHILCDSAWATFRAPSAMHEGTGGGERVESAVLNYQGDGWRVRFLNATVHDAAVTPAGDAGHPRSGGHGRTARRAAGGSSHHAAAKGKSSPASRHSAPAKPNPKADAKPAAGKASPAASTP